MSAQIERRQFEQYKRLVKFLGSLMIVLLELALYYYVWMNYYNRNMEVAFWRRGNWESTSVCCCFCTGCTAD